MATPNPSEELKLQQAIVSEIKQQLQLYNELMAKKKEISQTDFRAQNELNKQINSWKQLNKSVDRVKKDLQEAEGELRGLSKEAEKAAKALEAQKKATEDLTDNFSELDSFQRSITRRYGEQSDETRRINKNVDAIKASVGGIGKFLSKNVDLEEDQKNALEEAASYIKDMPSSFDRLNQSLRKGKINQKQYNKQVSELNDTWEEIQDKINFSDKRLKGFKNVFKKLGEAQGLSGEAGRQYENMIASEKKIRGENAVFGGILGAIPGGQSFKDLIDAQRSQHDADTKGYLSAMAGAGIGGGIASFLFNYNKAAMYLPFFGKYYDIVDKYAPRIAAAEGDINIEQAKFNKNAKIAGPLAKQYGKGYFYAAEATKNFKFELENLANEFNRASKTAFLGRGIGSIGYSAAQMQLAGVSAESVGNALTDLASTANVNFFGSKEGLGAQAAVFSREMGVSTNSIGEIMAAFRRIDGSSGKTALNMVYTSARMADIAKLNPSVILQDMAEASGKLLSYNIQNADAFVKQAIAIRQMGGNLPKFAQGITGSILNYRQSLEAQITLGNLINRPVDFSVAQSLAYSGKYKEAFANIKQSGVLEAVRKAGPLAAAQFSQIFGMSLDDFQAAAENQGKGLGLKGTLKGETNAFLGRVQGAAAAANIESARITVTKAVADAEFAKELAVGLNLYKPYRDAVNNLDRLTSQMNAILGLYYGLIVGAGASAGAFIAKGISSLFTGATMASGAKGLGGTPGLSGAAFAQGGKFYGWQKTGEGAAAMVRNAKGQFVSAAEAAEFNQASKMAKFAKFGKYGGRALGIAGAGFDAYGRLQSGQTGLQTAAGVATSMAGAYGGAQLGATIGAFGGPLAPVTVPLGSLVGGIIGYIGGGAAADYVTGANNVGQNVEQQQQQIQQMQETPDAILQTLENIEILMIDLVAIHAQNKDIKVFLDGADVTKAAMRKQLNMAGAIPGSTLGNALGVKK